MLSDFNRRNVPKNGRNRTVNDAKLQNGRGPKKRYGSERQEPKLFERVVPPQRISDQQIGGENITIGNVISSEKNRPAIHQNDKPSPQQYRKQNGYQPKYQQYVKNENRSLKITFLGGLNEIGKNITLFECNDDMFLLDCGMAFPDGDMLGVDLVIPDFTYIERNKDKIKGIVLTHGHEDHIGSLPYLLENMNLPIYGTSLTLGLVGSKLREHNLQSKAKLNVVNPGQRIKLGCMSIEFIHVNHSIPDAVALAIHTPAGIVVHTGDFKIDCTPTTGPVWCACWRKRA